MAKQKKNSKFSKLIILGVIGLIWFITKDDKTSTHQEVLIAEEETADYIDNIEVKFDEENGEADVTKNFMFILDGSGSMDDKCSGKRKMDGARVAISKFLEKVPEDVNMGLIVFDNNCTSVHKFEERIPLGPYENDAFESEIYRVQPGGSTPLAVAMKYGSDKLLDQYRKQLGYGDYKLVIVTDGQADDLKEASKYVTSRYVSIHSIGLCIEGNHPLRDYSLSYRDAQNYDDLERALEETLAETQSFDPTEFE